MVLDDDGALRRWSTRMMRGLYAICDVATLSARSIDPVAFARAVIAVRPAALQLRAKEVPAREALGLLRALGPICRQAHVPLIANDRLDLAVLAGCDGVHVGQEDVPVEFVRRMAPGLSVGISTHSLDQLSRALEARPTYVAFGPVFPTRSKPNAEPVVGLTGLREAARMAERAKIPLVAIGGIDLPHAGDIAASASCGAVIGALLEDCPDPKAVRDRARALHLALGGDDRLPEGLEGPHSAFRQRTEGTRP
jgi:thiamine-phosphate pyrophosphorylase